VALVALLAAGVASAGELWTENAQEAMAQAARENKDLLIDFTGSDWCGWCKKLDAEVFSQPLFQAEAPKQFVLLKLDFPHQRPLSAETKKQNAEWQAKLGVRGFPTIVLADASGKLYAKAAGYRPGGPDAYLKYLAELRQARGKPDAGTTQQPSGEAVTPPGAAFGGELWTENAQEAIARAAAEKKDLLVDFTGSDWCTWCKKLDEEVFSQPAFQAEARKRFVFLKLDFPHQRPLSEEMKKQNAEWQRRCAITSYPTIVLADASGRPYAKTGYRAGGPEAYAKQLATLRRARDTRDWAMAQAKVPQMAAAKILDKALAALDPTFIPGGYADVVQQIIALDADNLAGLKAKYETLLLVHQIGILVEERKLDEAIALADQALQKLGDTGQAAQDVYYSKYLAYARKKDRAAAKQALEAALKAAPTGTRAAQIRQILDRAFKE
jgi:thioredoxin-related protein